MIILIVIPSGWKQNGLQARLPSAGFTLGRRHRGGRTDRPETQERAEGFCSRISQTGVSSTIQKRLGGREGVARVSRLFSLAAPQKPPMTYFHSLPAAASTSWLLRHAQRG